MADPNLIFDPPTGHNDTVVFPANPAKEQTRGMFQRLHDQTRDWLNNTLLLWIKTTFATKTEIGEIVLGQIPDGSLTDIKLSNESGQIKDSVSKVTTDFNNYGANIIKNVSFTLALTENDKVVVMTGATSQTVTIPDNATVPFDVGTQITFIMQEIGTVTFTPSVGVTLYSKDTKRTIDGQYSSATLVKTSTDIWSLIGTLK